MSFYLQADSLACRQLTNVPRRHKTPRPETKDVIVQGTASKASFLQMGCQQRHLTFEVDFIFILLDSKETYLLLQRKDYL